MSLRPEEQMRLDILQRDFDNFKAMYVSGWTKEDAMREAGIKLIIAMEDVLRAHGVEPYEKDQTRRRAP